MALQEFGRSRLPELLEKRKLSQSEFARRLGVDQSFIPKIISKHSKFSLFTAIKAADILQCDVRDLYELIYD
jgi:transcriptional regulator with XRE-family HTH domain